MSFATGAAKGKLVPAVNVKSPGALPGPGFAVLVKNYFEGESSCVKGF